MKTRAVFLANLGDRNWLDYGGFLVFSTKNGTRIEMFDADSEEPRSERVIYRFDCERWFMRAVDPERPGDRPVARLVDRHGHKAWFDLRGVASATGQDEADLMNALCSDDAVERGAVYQDIVAYHGAHEFDQYPLTLTRTETARRYRSVDRAERRKTCPVRPA